MVRLGMVRLEILTVKLFKIGETKFTFQYG